MFFFVENNSKLNLFRYTYFGKYKTLKAQHSIIAREVTCKITWPST